MTGWGLVSLAGIVLCYAAFSRRLRTTPLSAPLFFTVAGVLAGTQVLGLIDPSEPHTTISRLAEATLAFVLFADASRVDMAALRRELSVPARLLSIGLPLTIAAGMAAAIVVLGLSVWEALVLSVALAPTDAALGQAVVTDERVPTRIRQGLNLESGLNDGLCVPLLFVAIGLAQAEEGTIGGGHAIRLVAEEIGWGVVGGVAAGVLAVLVLRYAVPRRLVDEAWVQVILPAAAGLAYGLATALGGSGFIAAFVGGLVFGLLRPSGGPQSSYLLEEAGALLSAATFVVFGAVVLGPLLGHLGWALGGYAFLSLTAVRMVPVAIAMMGAGARRATVAFVGWFGPRGLASIVFAVVILERADLANQQRLIDAISATVALSILLHGVTAVPFTRLYASWYESHPRLPEMESAPADPQPARQLGVRR